MRAVLAWRAAGGGKLWNRLKGGRGILDSWTSVRWLTIVCIETSYAEWKEGDHSISRGWAIGRPSRKGFQGILAGRLARG